MRRVGTGFLRAGAARVRVAAAILAVGAGLLPAGATAQAAPASVSGGNAHAAVPAVEPQQFTLDTSTLATGLTAPVAVSSPRDGSRRLFVLERDGVIKVVNQDTGVIEATPYLDIRDRVGINASDEHSGLIGIAFNPGWKTSPFVYLTYRDTENYLRVVRYRPVGGDPAAAALDPASAVEVLTAGRTPYNLFTGGGQLAFGPNGLLYIAVGGREYGAPQNLRALKGKVLRINTGCGTAVYCIPPGNPFAHDTSGRRKEIWAWGVKDPTGLSIDWATGMVWIADTAEQRPEVTARSQFGVGGNLGYPCYNGFVRTGNGCVSGTAYVMPRFDLDPAYVQDLTPGLVYRGGQPELPGFYVFGRYLYRYKYGYQFLASHNPGGAVDSWYDRGQVPPPPPAPYDECGCAYAPRVQGFGEGDLRELYAVLRDGTLRRIVVHP